jgi:hypothetical protein
MKFGKVPYHCRSLNLPLTLETKGNGFVEGGLYVMP